MVRTSGKLITALAVALLCGGCAQVQQVLAPAPQARQEQQVDAAAEYHPGGSAADNEAYFTLIAKEYAQSQEPFAGEAMVNAFAAAGFHKGDMQVSYDKTKINLDADSLFLSVRFGEECLIAQVGRASRDYVTQLAPAVGPDRAQCLIGQSRPIDW